MLVTYVTPFAKSFVDNSAIRRNYQKPGKYSCIRASAMVTRLFSKPVPSLGPGLTAHLKPTVENLKVDRPVLHIYSHR